MTKNMKMNVASSLAAIAKKKMLSPTQVIDEKLLIDNPILLATELERFFGDLEKVDKIKLSNITGTKTRKDFNIKKITIEFPSYLPIDVDKIESEYINKLNKMK